MKARKMKRVKKSYSVPDWIAKDISKMAEESGFSESLIISTFLAQALQSPDKTKILKNGFAEQLKLDFGK